MLQSNEIRGHAGVFIVNFTTCIRSSMITGGTKPLIRKTLFINKKFKIHQKTPQGNNQHFFTFYNTK